MIASVTNSKLKVYNTLTKTLEEFEPLEDKKVRIYACGLTVNDYMHIGHARTYLVWDVVVRYLRFLGYDVFYVSNITDITIDEKILKRLEEEKISFQQLIEKYTKAYFEDREALGILRADVHPLATQHIQEMIELIQKLLDKGYAYVAEDGVYFSIKKFPDYGKLSGIKASELLAGASGRITKDEYEKENVGDFALWKKTKENEPYWYSPWGKGRPGWHIECSAMSMKYLGESFDIHAGGEDNIFPHHENEIAQSEAATGKPFVKYWLHTRHVLLKGEKMSKSYKRLIYLRDAIKKHGASNLRFFLLSTHYRKQLMYDDELVEESKVHVDRIKKTVQLLDKFSREGREEITDQEKQLIENSKKAIEKFIESMNDDFNTPLAIKVIIDFSKQVLSHIEQEGILSKEASKSLLEFFDFSCKIIFGDLYEKEIKVRLNDVLVNWIEKLIKERNELRKQGKFEESDKIREEIRRIGIEVEDSKNYTFWYVKNLNIVK